MDTGSIVRTIILIISLANQFLAVAGKSPLPIADETVEVLVSTVITTGVSIWTWWKNNYISKKGQAQKEVLKQNDLA